MSRYDWLLFLHVLAAFMVVATVVVYTALLAPIPPALVARTAWIGDRLWDAGGLGVLVFGIWLAIDLDGYDIFDGWIIGALVLFFVATETGRRAARGFRADLAAGVRVQRPAVLWHVARSVAVLAILILMIYKPGAG